MELALLIRLDASSTVPLHRQLYQQIRDAILAGDLKPRTRLPSSRQLAKTLAVLRTTVVQSYDQLISEGYLQTRPGAGTFVCNQLPDNLLLVRNRQRADTDASFGKKVNSQPLKSASRASRSLSHLSSYGVRLANAADYESKLDCPFSFRYGLPDLSLFPWQQWRKLLNRQAAKGHDWMSYAAEPMGHEGLRQEIASYIGEVRAVRCSPEQILITGGTQQALSLISRVLLDVGEAIAFEDPGYLSAKRIFSARGAVVVPVPVDEDGIRVNGLGGLVEIGATEAALEPRLVYVTPSHQFPLGVLMSLSKRLALLRWAKENGALIIEDDYDSEFRYSGSPIPALQGLDNDECVLYVGTFSKVMFPGLRLGYVVLPPSLVDVFRRAKWLCDRQCSLLEQAALAEFIRGGYLAGHIRRMRNIYDRRRRLLIEAIQQALPDVTIPGDASGLHILARWPQDGSPHNGACNFLDRLLITQAKERGVSLFSARPHYWRSHQVSSPKGAAHKRTAQNFLDESAREDTTAIGCELIFGFGNIAADDIDAAMNRIRSLF